MMIDRQIIKQRKKIYGDNFKAISDYWSMYLDRTVTEKDVCFMMADMKEARIKAIKLKLDGLDLLSEEAKTLLTALEDSQKDKANYLYIGTHWAWYSSLGETKDIHNTQIRFKKNPIHHAN